jgi:hypothetical protein
MKKIYFFVLAICMISGTLNAQKAYIRVGLGGGIGLKQYVGTFWADETATNTTDEYIVKSVGLGGGFNANVAFGYKISDYIGIEFGINEFVGLPKKVTGSYTGTYPYSFDDKISGMMLQIVPAIVITPGLEKVNPYARLGMIIGVLPTVVMTSNNTNSYEGTSKATYTTDFKEKLYGGLAVGFTAAGGVNLKLSDKLAFYGEVVFNGITYAPSKGKYKEFTRNGVDQLSSMTTREKEWIYVRKYDADETIADTDPDKQAKVSIDFSNVELNIGIAIKL